MFKFAKENSAIFVVGLFIFYLLLQIIYEGKKESVREPGVIQLRHSNGKIPELVLRYKNNLKDPDSFEHINTKYIGIGDKGNKAYKMTYRAKNSFGGYVTETTIATFTPTGTFVGFGDLRFSQYEYEQKQAELERKRLLKAQKEEKRAQEEEKIIKTVFKDLNTYAERLKEIDLVKQEMKESYINPMMSYKQKEIICEIRKRYPYIYKIEDEELKKYLVDKLQSEKWPSYSCYWKKF